MGYTRLHAIVVSGCYGDFIEQAHDRARVLFPWVSPISPAFVNGYRSFFIPPDGSKEGWPESERGDERRTEFIAWLRGARYEDLSSPLDWIEVQFGDDEGETVVLRHSDETANDHHA